MKFFLFPVITAAILIGFLPSCTSPTPTVPVRGADGKFVSPACPTCDSKPVSYRTLYECPNGHSFQSEKF